MPGQPANAQILKVSTADIQRPIDATVILGVCLTKSLDIYVPVLRRSGKVGQDIITEHDVVDAATQHHMREHGTPGLEHLAVRPEAIDNNVLHNGGIQRAAPLTASNQSDVSNRRAKRGLARN